MAKRWPRERKKQNKTSNHHEGASDSNDSNREVSYIHAALGNGQSFERLS